MKDKNEEKDSLTFNMRFDEIKIIKYSQFDLEKEFDINAIPLAEFQSNFKFRVIENEEKLACLATVKIVINETKEEFAELRIENFFEINPFKDIFKSNAQDGFEIPDGIIINVASVSASTMRGILFEKLKGTIVQKEIYPLIDMTTLLLNKKKNL